MYFKNSGNAEQEVSGGGIILADEPEGECQRESVWIWLANLYVFSWFHKNCLFSKKNSVNLFVMNLILHKNHIKKKNMLVFFRIDIIDKISFLFWCLGKNNNKFFCCFVFCLVLESDKKNRRFYSSDWVWVYFGLGQVGCEPN